MGIYCAPCVAGLFCFVMTETSCCLCQPIIKLIIKSEKFSNRRGILLIQNPHFWTWFNHNERDRVLRSMINGMIFILKQ